MNTHATAQRELFLHEAAGRLHTIRRHAGVLRGGRPSAEALEELGAAAQVLAATSACYGLPRFADLSSRLAALFTYLQTHDQPPGAGAALAAFVAQAAALLDSTLLAWGRGAAEPESEYAAFRARYPFVFAPAGEPPLPGPAPAGGEETELPEDCPAPDPELFDIFVGEAEEQLETMTDCLLALESGARGGEVHRLFRAMHTLKGSAAQVGLRRMALVAHAAEELLVALRWGRVAPTTELLYVCLEAVDTLRKFLYRQWSDEAAAAEQVAGLLRRLSAAGQSAPPATRAAIHPALLSLDAAPLAEPPVPQPRLVRVLADRLEVMAETTGELDSARKRVLGRLAELERSAAELRQAAAGPPAELPTASALESLGAMMHSIDSDLEDFARLTDRLEREIRRATLVPMGGLFLRVTRTVREAATEEGKQVQLILHGGDTEVDSRMLHQLSDPLLHLVRNAIAHGIETDEERYAAGKSATAQLAVRAYRRPSLICVDVEDDGRGLDFESIRAAAVAATMLTAEAAAHLDESQLLGLLFQPGFSTRMFANQVAGRGVGLDAVAASVVAMNGEIEVQTRPGAGARFTLKVPLQPLAAPPPRAPQAASAPAIVLIEPDLALARSLAEGLRREGFETLHFTAAGEAVSLLEWSKPAAILCSTLLRELGACELTRLLRADARTAGIPVIALGEGSGEALLQAYRAGCDDCVGRDQSPQSIATRLHAFLRSRSQKFQPIQMLENADSVFVGNLKHLDLPGLIQMLSHARQTGILHVNSESADGILLFQNGELFHAESGGLAGDDAVLHVVKACNNLGAGGCKFVPGGVSSIRTVRRSAPELMLEALRQCDEDERNAAAAEGLA